MTCCCSNVHLTFIMITNENDLEWHSNSLQIFLSRLMFTVGPTPTEGRDGRVRKTLSEHQKKWQRAPYATNNRKAFFWKLPKQAWNLHQACSSYQDTQTGNRFSIWSHLQFFTSVGLPTSALQLSRIRLVGSLKTYLGSSYLAPDMSNRPVNKWIVE